MRKILVVIETYLQALAMCPLVDELKKRKIQTVLCVLDQNRYMVSEVLDTFALKPDYVLDAVGEEQSLLDTTIDILCGMRGILEKEHPDMALVHGGTALSLSTTLACYYMQIPVGHVDAGWRTYDVSAPYPQELNHQVISLIAAYHFSETEQARYNLVTEGKDPSYIYICGNPLVDVLSAMVMTDYRHEYLDWVGDHRLIIITAQSSQAVIKTARLLCNSYSEIKVICMFPSDSDVWKTAHEMLNEDDKIRIIEPLKLMEFHNLLEHADVIVTDLYGVGEEAVLLDKAVVAIRGIADKTAEGNLPQTKYIADDSGEIFESVRELLENSCELNDVESNKYVSGKNTASKRIAGILEEELLKPDFGRNDRHLISRPVTFPAFY